MASCRCILLRVCPTDVRTPVPEGNPNGVTLDKCIQVSLDNMGKINGLVAGDEECYEVGIGLLPCYSSAWLL